MPVRCQAVCLTPELDSLEFSTPEGCKTLQAPWEMTLRETLTNAGGFRESGDKPARVTPRLDATAGLNVYFKV